MLGTKLIAQLLPQDTGRSGTIAPQPDGAHAVGAPLRPPSGRPPLRAHRVPNQALIPTDEVHDGIPGRAAISPAYPTCDPGQSYWYLEAVPELIELAR